MKIAIFGNTYQAAKIASAELLFAALGKYDISIYIDKDFAQFLMKNSLYPPSAKVFEGDNFTANMAISVGGDGTFLKTFSRVAAKGIPIIGINAGRLGFLADISRNEVGEAIDELMSGNYSIEERTVLEIEGAEFNEKKSRYALNEIAVLKQDSASMITICAELDGSLLNHYQADGLIVATPTGSTGYSLSVGGPILMPNASNFVISPVAPHSLNVRPIVVTDDQTVTLLVDSRTGNYLVSIDGSSEAVECGSKITLRKAPIKVLVVKRNSHYFLDTLRTKLMWGADPRG